MMKLATIALVPLFAGYLCAQTQTTETTTTTINGTLVDAGCHTTHTHTTTETATQKTETSRDVTECPVTTTTTSFGLITPEGKYVAFDEGGNTRVVEMVKGKHWNTYITEHKPIKVKVIGSHHGEVMVVRTIE